MPLPMVHLSVGNRLTECIDIRHRGQFHLGCIAPDAIHMRVNSDRENKRVVHLIGSDKDLYNRIEIVLSFFHQRLAGPESPAGVDFLKGYVTHILTDNLWSHLLGRFFKIDFTAGWTEESRRQRYYDETDKVDFILYRKVPWRPDVFREIAGIPCHDFYDLLTGEEIGKWRDRLIVWFTETKREPEVDLSYFTEEKVQRFIDTASESIARLLEKPDIEKAGEIVERYPEHCLSDIAGG